MATQSEIQAVFDQYGVATSLHADGTYEDPVARLARLEASGRSIEDITAAVASIASAQGIFQPVGGRSYNGVPGTPELWFVSDVGGYYLVYFVPGTQIPLLYTATPAEVQAMVGPGQPIVADRTLTAAQVPRTGAVQFGDRSHLANTTEDPFLAWVSAVEAQAAVRPWLREPEVLALLAAALVEGRSVSEAEFQQTAWWRDHNESQRQWMLLSESDPATAAQLMGDQVLALRQMFTAAGSSNPPDDLLRQMATQYVSGNWTAAYLTDQVRALSDPASGIAVDSLLSGAGLDTTRGQELQAASLYEQWLGPVFGRDQAAITRWAGRLRNDPDAEVELIESLRQARLALLPEYENPNLTYEDIAGPWRGFWSQQWGQFADELDPLFVEVMRSGDAVEAAKLMRSAGISRGIPKVTNDLLDFGAEIAGPQVRSLS
jgi:hypothetical protein